MRKRIVRRSGQDRVDPGHWLDLEALAEVELTSEDAAHPIEAALALGGAAGSGWRAAEPGRQSIRLLFQVPQRLRRIRLHFEERDAERTQEYTLRWSTDGGDTYREVVRQQYTFSPAGATSEVEDLAVDLPSVTALELTIIPDQRGQAHATLAGWRVG